MKNKIIVFTISIILFSIVVSTVSSIAISNYQYVNVMKANLKEHNKMLVDIINNNDKFSGDIFIIGGGQIYKELLPFCDRIYITKIFKSHNNVDTYFPILDQKEWEIVNQSEILTFNDL